MPVLLSPHRREDYAYMSALRGPDDPRCATLKSFFTAPLRKLLGVIDQSVLTGLDMWEVSASRGAPFFSDYVARGVDKDGLLHYYEHLWEAYGYLAADLRFSIATRALAKVLREALMDFRFDRSEHYRERVDKIRGLARELEAIEIES
jgi:hypothetical protein